VNDRNEQIRRAADESLGLVVSLVTVASEDSDEFSDRNELVRQLLADQRDLRYLGQALSFACKLLAIHMTAEEVRWVADELIEDAITWG
jgi:hypothetical protein